MDKGWGWLLLAGLVLLFFLRRPNATSVSNEETWEWVDWLGNRRSITVHRDVKAQ